MTLQITLRDPGLKPHRVEVPNSTNVLELLQKKYSHGFTTAHVEQNGEPAECFSRTLGGIWAKGTIVTRVRDLLRQRNLSTSEEIAYLCNERAAEGLSCEEIVETLIHDLGLMVCPEREQLTFDHASGHVTNAVMSGRIGRSDREKFPVKYQNFPVRYQDFGPVSEKFTHIDKASAGCEDYTVSTLGVYDIDCTGNPKLIGFSFISVETKIVASLGHDDAEYAAAMGRLRRKA